MTRVSLLDVTFLTTAGVTSRSVYAILLAQVISSRALVQVPAADAVRIQNETRRTRTDETAFGVLAGVLARSWRQFALVNVCDFDSM